MTGDPHGPNRLTNYEQIHTTIMQRLLREGFILSEDLSFEDLGNGYIVIEGTIDCTGGIEIQVAKRLQIVSGAGASAMVRTIAYTYNVHLKGQGNIFRYDSPHPDHNQFHHVHRFDVLAGDHDGRADAIPDQADWPPLNAVIGEAEAWYFEHYEALIKLRQG